MYFLRHCDCGWYRGKAADPELQVYNLQLQLMPGVHWWHYLLGFQNNCVQDQVHCAVIYKHWIKSISHLCVFLIVFFLLLLEKDTSDPKNFANFVVAALESWLWFELNAEVWLVLNQRRTLRANHAIQLRLLGRMVAMEKEIQVFTNAYRGWLWSFPDSKPPLGD